MDHPSSEVEAKPPPRPTWVKVLLLGIVAVVVALVIAKLVFGGDHGPGRHLPGGDSGQEGSASEGHTPPVEHGG